MNSVSLVCTVHEEVGAANAAELHTILTHIRPEVIFVEVPRAQFADYYETCTQHNLESTAIRQYQIDHPVELIPVDAPLPGPEFFDDHAFLHSRISAASLEYRQLLSSDSANIRAHGFNYLNSDSCSKLWSEIYRVTSITVESIGDAKLVETNALWQRTNELREKIMVGNIQEFCSGRIFGRSVFLVGAAHRQGIIDKCNEAVTIESGRFLWDYTPSWPK
jgi:hypothetical protein